jgi:predicted acyltransferase
MKERYFSLDIFRGATVAFMIMVNNQAGTSYEPLDHAPWHGLTPTDLVFPFFLFAVGNAMSFVAPRQQQAGSGKFLSKVLRRTLLIFLIGLFLNWSPFLRWDHDHLVFKGWEWINDKGNLSGIRVMGVLQRISLCYLFASLIIFYFKPRTVYIISVSMLLLYWILCLVFGAPGDPYSLHGFFGTNIDINLFGEPHVYHGEGVPFDPEGLASTLPAIVNVIAGYFIGKYIQEKGKNYEMLSKLFLTAVGFLFLGYCWSLTFPVNKKIWTSSYVLVSVGLAIVVLSVLINTLEFKNKRDAWSNFFNVFGKNALFIFVLSGFLPRVLNLIRINNGVDATNATKFTSPFGWFYEHVCTPITNTEQNASLLYSICIIFLYWFFGYILDKKKIYIRV